MMVRDWISRKSCQEGFSSNLYAASNAAPQMEGENLNVEMLGINPGCQQRCPCQNSYLGCFLRSERVTLR